MLLGGSALLQAQYAVEVRPAARVALPFLVDSNTPSFWRDGLLHVFSSTGEPLAHVLDARGKLISTERVQVHPPRPFPLWIESVWQHPDGRLFAWYHEERTDLCPGSNLTVPQIGALLSYDGGSIFLDLGIVLRSGDPANCEARNGYFAGGHGDFSVIPDRDGQYFYFLFGNYGGDPSTHGVAAARLAAEDLLFQTGAVWKYYRGEWSEPGLDGRVTPVFPAAAGWDGAQTDAFWGPSIHWNAAVRQYVIFLNRACCSPGWPQEGIYISMTPDIAEPATWARPPGCSTPTTGIPPCTARPPARHPPKPVRSAAYMCAARRPGRSYFTPRSRKRGGKLV